ncbi:hypothetical protein WMY93_006750 [Mugilogobius chulae]|uniref:ribonuclease H n=1 Tax=Mugilogobius chulae TaxID=88201 RepID=A0AAW0PLE2_9GOBI
MDIDDWLLAAHSSQQLREHTELLLAHLTSLGFTINWEKSVLVPSQSAKFIGLRLNSVTYKAQLSVERIEAFSAYLATFRRGALLHYRTCHMMMASALVVIPLGRLYMRPFQKWVTAFHLDPARHEHKLVPVTAACVCTLSPWRCQGLLSAGVPMGTVIARKVITTDASLRGWGAMHEGRTGQHVLVRTDNTTVVAYINKQGGLRSHQLHALSHSQILWADSHLLSLRATHVPGIMNRGADLFSRGIPCYKDWMLHNEVVSQIWERFGRAEVDLFASQENAQCHLFFSLGLDAFAHECHVLLYAFPPLELITATLSWVRERRHSLLLVAPHWPPWMVEIFQILCSQPWSLPLRRDLVSQAGGEIFHAHPERLALWVWPLREEHQQLHALCAVRALRVYVDKTASFRENEQLFVSWAPPHRGKPLTKLCLTG